MFNILYDPCSVTSVKMRDDSFVDIGGIGGIRSLNFFFHNMKTRTMMYKTCQIT
jgi:hypothetical protein